MSNHFYTTSGAERDSAHNFEQEGIACYVFPTQASGTVPLYRLYQPARGFHMYTTSAAEVRNAVATNGWVSEGIACYLFPQQQPGTVPLYRLNQPSVGDHLYTTSLEEHRVAIQNSGYQDEGVAGYVYAGPAEGAVPFYRLLLARRSIPVHGAPHGDDPEPKFPGTPFPDPPQPAPEPFPPEGGGCFAPETLVAADPRRLLPIGDLREGDLVVSRDEHTGEMTPRRVLRTWVHERMPTVTLDLEDGEAIRTTQAHRFFAAGKGLVAVAALAVGDRLQTLSGGEVRITGIQNTGELSTVHNLTVEGFHTYFVGRSGVWVHNVKQESGDPPK